MGLLYEFGHGAEAIIAGDLQSKTTQEIIEILNHEYHPQLLLLYAPSSVQEKPTPPELYYLLMANQLFTSVKTTMPAGYK